jgi:hypothetical protein
MIVYTGNVKDFEVFKPSSNGNVFVAHGIAGGTFIANTASQCLSAGIDHSAFYHGSSKNSIISTVEYHNFFSPAKSRNVLIAKI